MQHILWWIGVFIIAIWFILRPGKYTEGQKSLFYGVNHAHRGLHTPDKSIPENSLPAFGAAVAAGYGIELDIQLSRDEEVVVFHDDTLSRVCGKEGRVDDYLLKQLLRFHLCGTEEKIPLLTEVLQLVDGKVPLIIELKTGPRNQLLCEKAMEILRDYKGVYCIESFDPRIVRWFKKHQPQILRGQLTDRPENFKGQPRLQSFALGNVLTNVLARPQFIAYGPGPKTRCARLADAMGAMRVCWTVRKEEEAAQKQDENDAVIFEFYLPEPIYK